MLPCGFAKKLSATSAGGSRNAPETMMIFMSGLIPRACSARATPSMEPGIATSLIMRSIGWEFEHGKGFEGVGRFDHLVTVAAQLRGEIEPDQRLIFDEKDSSALVFAPLFCGFGDEHEMELHTHYNQSAFPGV